MNDYSGNSYSTRIDTLCKYWSAKEQLAEVTREPDVQGEANVVGD